MDTFNISELEVDLFDLSINLACFLQRRERLARIEDLLKRIETVLADRASELGRSGPHYFRRADRCLVISFDRSWYPFLDDSMGYNRPDMRSWYVPKNSMLDHVVEAMQNLQLPQNGGRTFLHANGAMRAGKISLVKWTLAKDSRYLMQRRQQYR